MFGGYGSINEYFEKEKEVYVRNMSKPLGVISIPLNEAEDRTFALARTTAPVCLTNFVPKEQLIKSAGFRRLVQRGVLQLLSQKEYDALIAQMGQPAKVQAYEDMVLTAAPQQTEATTTVAGAELTINPKVLQIVSILKTDDKDFGGVKPSVNALIQELEMLDLTEDDLAYLMTNATGKVKTWAKNKVQKLVQPQTSE